MLHCGTLYLLSVSGPEWLDAITPLGRLDLDRWLILFVAGGVGGKFLIKQTSFTESIVITVGALHARLVKQSRGNSTFDPSSIEQKIPVQGP